MYLSPFVTIVTITKKALIFWRNFQRKKRSAVKENANLGKQCEL